MSILNLTVASGDTSLEARRFSVRESISTCFTMMVWARSPNPSVDLESIVGQPASLSVAPVSGSGRRWEGVCSSAELAAAEPSGLSTYFFRIVPTLWLLGKRRNHRLFQHETLPDIADDLLTEWGLEAVWNIDRKAYPALELRVQYGESDLDFFDRVLEEAGIAYTFPDDGVTGSRLTLGERLHGAEPRAGAVRYADHVHGTGTHGTVRDVRLGHEVRAGARATRDHDFHRPRYRLLAEAPKAEAPEDRYEQYHYAPGAFLVHGGKDEDTPIADDQGIVRHDDKAGADRVERELVAERTGKRAVSFDTNLIDLYPGVVFAISDHPHPEIDLQKLLVTELVAEGMATGELAVSCRAVPASTPYRPPLRTSRPRIRSVQSATIVGPKGAEIHTDEFGRVRVQLPWDREGENDERSSCWMRVSQGWAGSSYGMMHVPRVGQEVLINFLDGNPDQPIVTGRAYNRAEPVPYHLPEQKTRSAWKGDSSPRDGKAGFNEIFFDDRKDEEVLFLQAERQLRALVKNDETITVGHDRTKEVAGHETDTTGHDRVEVTGHDRTQTIEGSRTTVIGGDRAVLVQGTSTERVEVEHRVLMAKDDHLVVKRDRLSLVEGHDDLHVQGGEALGVDGTLSIFAPSLQISIRGDVALATGGEIHLAAADDMIGEGADVTLSGPGGFVRIDAGGVTIVGTVVQINAGGSELGGLGAGPTAPAPPKEAKVDKPCPPQEPLIINVLGPKDQGCGGYDWTIKWCLPKPACSDGWVIQELLGTFTVHGKDGKTILSTKQHYWEAWEVKKGKKITVYQESGAYPHDDEYAGPVRPNTKGTITYRSIARFYEGPLPADFVAGSVRMAGILHATRTKPKFWDGKGIVHDITAKWDCTTAPESSSVSTQAGDEKRIGTK